MTKPKLRVSWGGKIEAYEGLGVAKPNVRRASGSTWGRSRELWADSGGSRSVQGDPIGFRGEPPANSRADFLFFFFWAEKIYIILAKDPPQTSICKRSYVTV